MPVSRTWLVCTGRMVLVGTPTKRTSAVSPTARTSTSPPPPIYSALDVWSSGCRSSGWMASSRRGRDGAVGMQGERIWHGTS